MEYFDYQTIAAQAKLSKEQLAAIIERLRGEFPNDPMMLELHILRACMAIRDKRITVEEALNNLSPAVA